MKLLTAQQMRTLDRRATEEFGIPSLLLMENAGRAVARAAVERLGSPVGSRVLVVCGPGNNGGDGFAAARHLHNSGAEVVTVVFGNTAAAKGDAKVNFEIAQKMGLPIESSEDHARLRRRIAESDLVVDAMLGTGISGELKPSAAQIVNEINRSRTPVLAVDIPSGIDADTGCVCGCAVEAEATVTFGLPKIGLVTYPGAKHVGRLIVADISIPARILTDNDSQTYLLEEAVLRDVLPERPPDAHKGTFGHLALVAGSPGMTGAAALAAAAALRIGTGLVTAAVPESINPVMEVKLTEAMTLPVAEDEPGAFGPRSAPAVLSTVDGMKAAVIGPGLGRREKTLAFALTVIEKLTCPSLIDADGLFAVAGDLSVLKKCAAPLVLTPHPGEMAHLLGTSVEEVQSNRLETARTFSRDHGVVVVLKGAGTVVAGPNGDAYINPTGTPAMASGGMGDVLSGIIGGLMAQGVEPVLAAATGVYIHGRAGEIAAERSGGTSVLASDVAESVPQALGELRQEA